MNENKAVQMADAIKRKIRPGERTITIGRVMARELVKCLEEAGKCQSDEKRPTD